MKGVTGPLLITAVIVAVGNGWILAAWNVIYTWTHTGNAGPPVANNGDETVKPVIGGGDASGLGKDPSHTSAKNLIPGNPNTNPNLS